jgi:plastocyanin
MGIIVAVICFIIGIPVFLFGALIFTGLSIAGIIGSPVMIPAIIFASALLLVGAFLMFMGWRNIQEKKVMTVNANGLDPSNIKTSATKRNVSIAKGLVIVVVVAITLISAIAIGAAVIDPLLNQMSSDIDTDTDTTDDAGTDETETVTNPDNTETTIAMEDSDFEPEETRVPLNDNIVWENHEDDPPHTATSGTGSDDPDSGKIFDTGVINGGDQSAPLQLTGAKVGDEIPYFCTVHPSMTGKLIVTSAAAWQNTTAAS